MTWRTPQKISLLTLAAVLVLVGAVPELAWAGAWAQPKGQYYTKLSSIFYRSDEVFDAAGDRQPITIYGSNFRANQGFLYAEYGLLERLTLITQLSGASLESENNIRHNVLRLTTSGLGDVVLGAKYQLVGTPIVLSPFAGVKISVLARCFKQHQCAIGVDGEIGHRVARRPIVRGLRRGMNNQRNVRPVLFNDASHGN